MGVWGLFFLVGGGVGVNKIFLFVGGGWGEEFFFYLWRCGGVCPCGGEKNAVLRGVWGCGVK